MTTPSEVFADEQNFPGFAKVVIDRRNGRLWINDTHMDFLIAEELEISGLGTNDLPTLDMPVFIESVEWVDDYQPLTVDLRMPTLAALH